MSRLPIFVRHGAFPEALLAEIREAGLEIVDIDEHAARMRCVLLLWSWLYYQGEPEVSDALFDSMFKRLQEAEARDPRLVTPLSPTQRVGRIMV